MEYQDLLSYNLVTFTDMVQTKQMPEYVTFIGATLKRI